MLKHNLKEHYVKELKNSNSRQLFLVFSSFYFSILKAEVCNIPTSGLCVVSV